MNRATWPERLLVPIAVGLFALMAAVVPLLILPPSILQQFDTDRAASMLVKLVFLQACCAGIIVSGAILFAGKSFAHYRGHAALPSIALAGFLLWGGVSIALSPVRHHSFYYWLIVAMPAAAALTAPMMLRNERHRRFVLATLLCTGVVVCAIGVAGGLGLRSFNLWAYGIDFHDPIAREAAKVEGGTRSVAMSTVGNPAYAGDFSAVIAAIAAALLFDWAPRTKRPGLWRTVLLGVIGLTILELLFTGTRQPWIWLAMAGLLRLFLALGVRPIFLAGGFGAFLLAALVAGPPTGVAVLAAAILAGFGYTFVKGTMGAAFRASDHFTRALLLGGPALVVIGLVAFSTKGPWNPTDLRLLQRFAGVTKSTDASVRERTLLYMAASQILWENPIAGAGPGRFANRFPLALAELAYADDSGATFVARPSLVVKIADQVHSDYLHVAAEYGAVGLMLFLAAIISALHCLYRIVQMENDPRRPMAIVVLCGTIAMLGIMLMSFPLQMPTRSATFWILIALALGMAASDGEAET